MCEERLENVVPFVVPSAAELGVLVTFLVSRLASRRLRRFRDGVTGEEGVDGMLRCLQLAIKRALQKNVCPGFLLL